MSVDTFFIFSNRQYTPFLNRADPGYNDIGLYDTSSITSDILWYQLVSHY